MPGYRLKIGTQPDCADGGGEQNFRGQWLRIGYLVGCKLFWDIKQLLRVERAIFFVCTPLMTFLVVANEIKKIV